MTRDDLCQLLSLPADTAAGQLVRSRQQRLAEIEEQFQTGALTKPVKIKLSRERDELESAAGLLPELELVDRIEGKFAEIAAEFAKPRWVGAVIRFCTDELAPQIARVQDEAHRHAFNKQLLLVKDRLATPPEAEPQSAPPPAPPSPPPPRMEAPAKAVPAVQAPVAPPVVARSNELPKRGSQRPFDTVPPFAGPVMSTGCVLRLIPQAVSPGARTTAPIHFVHRGCFMLGRQDTGVDFPTRFLPRSVRHDEMTDTISRINTTFSLHEGGLFIQDGVVTPTGEIKPSNSGTFIDGRRITAPVELSFASERRLRVGQMPYELSVLHLPGGPTGGGTPPRPAGGGELSGCLRFRAITCPEVPVQAVWIFTEATLGSSPQCAVQLGVAGMPAVALKINWRDGRFHLELPLGGLSSALLDTHRLAWGDTVPLGEKHDLQIGPLRYKVRVVQTGV